MDIPGIWSYLISFSWFYMQRVWPKDSVGGTEASPRPAGLEASFVALAWQSLSYRSPVSTWYLIISHRSHAEKIIFFSKNTPLFKCLRMYLTMQVYRSVESILSTTGTKGVQVVYSYSLVRRVGHTSRNNGSLWVHKHTGLLPNERGGDASLLPSNLMRFVHFAGNSKG